MKAFLLTAAFTLAGCGSAVAPDAGCTPARNGTACTGSEQGCSSLYERCPGGSFSSVTCSCVNGTLQCPVFEPCGWNDRDGGD